MVSAAVGVSCAQWIPDLFLPSGLAVGLAIFAMHQLNCLHPPGGAAALVAVVGGEHIHALGYLYVLVPVGLNVVIPGTAVTKQVNIEPRMDANKRECKYLSPRTDIDIGCRV